MNARIRNYCFTSYTVPKPDLSKIQYMVYQKEKCPETGREHYQGYVEFPDKHKLGGVKDIFNDRTLHLEGRRGTQKQAIDYCQKEKSRLEKPFIYGTPKNQGHRSDMDEIWDDIDEGLTMKEILANQKGNAVRMIHCIEKAMKVRHDLCPLDDYIKLKAKAKHDKFDELILEKLEKMLYK